MQNGILSVTIWKLFPEANCNWQTNLGIILDSIFKDEIANVSVIVYSNMGEDNFYIQKYFAALV